MLYGIPYVIYVLRPSVTSYTLLLVLVVVFSFAAVVVDEPSLTAQIDILKDIRYLRVIIVTLRFISKATDKMLHWAPLFASNVDRQ
jgi:hypothetical protein